MPGEMFSVPLKYVNFVWPVEYLGNPHKNAISPNSGVTWYFSASAQNSAVSSRTLSGYFSATSSACEKFSSRLYNSHLSLSGFNFSGANRAGVGGSSFQGIRAG